MKVLFITLISFLILDYAHAQSLKSDGVMNKINELEEQILELQLRNEARSSVDIMGSLENIYTSVNRNQDSELNNFYTYYSRLRLSFNKTDNQNLKFYSTLNATYRWNEATQKPRNIYYDEYEQEQGIFPFIERAYIDYFFSSDMSLSIGKLPTMFGPPMHKSIGEQRLGSYPMQSYSVPLDGIALSKNFGDNKTRRMLKYIYTPFINQSDPVIPSETGRSSTFSNLNVRNGLAHSIMFENTSHFNETILDLVLQATHIQFGRVQTTQNVRGVLNSQLGATQTDTNVYELGSNDDDLIKADVVALSFELDKLFGSSFDIYGSLKRSWIESTGNFNAVLVEDNMGGALGSEGDVYDLGGFLYDDNKAGNSYILGILKNYKHNSFGFEYIRNEFGFFPSALNDIRMTELYNTLGTNLHGFLNIQLETELTLSLGYYYTDQEAEFAATKYVLDDGRIYSNTFYAMLRYAF